jgi:hypothetical protein
LYCWQPADDTAPRVQLAGQYAPVCASCVASIARWREI